MNRPPPRWGGKIPSPRGKAEGRGWESDALRHRGNGTEAVPYIGPPPTILRKCAIVSVGAIHESPAAPTGRKNPLPRGGGWPASAGRERNAGGKLKVCTTLQAYTGGGHRDAVQVFKFPIIQRYRPHSSSVTSRFRRADWRQLPPGGSDFALRAGTSRTPSPTMWVDRIPARSGLKCCTIRGDFLWYFMQIFTVIFHKTGRIGLYIPMKFPLSC